MPTRSLCRRLLAALCAVILAGCVPGVNQPYPTYTPDRTLEAIPRMLTATRGAPTITPTVYRSPTPTRTATATPPRPGSSVLPGRPGEQIRSGGAALTVLSVREPETIGTLRKKEDTRYLDLEVLIENTGTAGEAYNRLYFRLAGEDAEYESLAQAAGPVLLSGSLRPGERVRGHAAFAIPAEAQPTRLIYNPQDDTRAVWVRLDQDAAAGAPVPATGTEELIAGLPRPGQRVEAGGLALRVEQVSAAERIQLARPEKGQIFVDLEVSLWNDGYEVTPFNAGYFRVKDALGYEYAPTTAPSEALIHAGSLRRGETVRGHVIFEVPAGTTELLLKYQPTVLTADYEEIRVGVPLPAVE